MKDKNDNRRDLARGGTLSFVGSVSSAALGFLLTIIITRLLGADGSGVVFQATGVFAMVMAFAKLGLDSTAIYLLPRVRLDDVTKLRATIMAFVIAAVVASLILGVVLILIAPFLWRGEVAATVRALMIFVPVGSVLLITSAILRALGSVKEYVLVNNIAVPALRPPLVAVAALATGSALAVTIAWALPLALFVVIAGFLVVGHIRREEGELKGALLPTREQWRTIVYFAAPRTLSAGLEQALIWLDVLLVGWLVSDQAAGIYGGAARLIQAGLVVDAALRVVVSPKFSSLLHQDKKDEVRDLYVTATMWLVLVASPIYILLAVFSPVFLTILGPEFHKGAIALSILAVAMTVTFMAGNIHSLLLMSGRSGWAAINKAVVLLINIGANLLLLPHYGIVGAAYAWTLSMLIDALLAAIEVRIFLGIRAQISEVLLPLGVVIFSFGLPSIVIVRYLDQSVLSVVFAALVGLILYLLVCWKLREKLHIDGLVAMLRTRR